MRLKLAAFLVGLSLAFGIGFGVGTLFDLAPEPVGHNTHKAVDSEHR